MTIDDLRAFVEAADAYKQQKATVAQANLRLGRYPIADVAALAQVALAAVRYVHSDQWLSREYSELKHALRNAGLLH